MSPLPRTIRVYIEACADVPAWWTRVSAARLNQSLGPDFQFRVQRVEQRLRIRSHHMDVSSLRAIQARFRERIGVRDPPPIHVLVARRLSGSAALGLLYDATASSTFVRLGCAVFTDPIASGPHPDETYFKTLCHELGHVLNLAHEDGGRTGVMRQGRARRWPISFSAASRHHLERHNPHWVAPGGTAGCFQRRPDGRFAHRRPLPGISTNRTRLVQALEPSRSKRCARRRTATFFLGEPVFLRYVLANRLKRRSVSLEEVDGAGLDVLPQVRIMGGEWQPILPEHQACGFEGDFLAPNSTRGTAELLFRRRAGVIFPAAGVYWLRGLTRVDDDFVASPATRIEIAPPLNDRHRNELSATLDDRLAGLLAGGTRPNELAEIEQVAALWDRLHAGHPMRDWACYARGRDEVRAFLNSDSGEAADAALRWLDRLSRSRRASPILVARGQLWRGRLLHRRRSVAAAVRAYRRTIESSYPEDTVRASALRGLVQLEKEPS